MTERKGAAISANRSGTGERVIDRPVQMQELPEQEISVPGTL
ncbi:MAG TPA: hypothetical protein VN371_05480 [Chlorobaculum sp.]|nr:hypothetical protein [Chlorobaculum sp.]